ncbi:MAG: DUF3194 domain-containing protein [Candidatus Bathyarchaeia archaeon]
MEEIGISELTSEQVETLSAVAEKAARNYVLSKVPSRKVSVLNISVGTEGLKPVTVDVEVEIILAPLMKNYDVKKLAEEATKQAFKAVEAYLRELACRSAR